MATHPENAAFVSKDGLVSFDEYGRKLDSNGNVAWGDYQSLRGAGAQPRQEYWDRKFQAEMAAQQAPSQPAVEAAPSQWRETVAPGPVAPGGVASPGAMPTPGVRVATAPGQSNRRQGQGQPAAAGAMRGFPNSPAPQLPPGLAPVGGGQGQPRYDPLSSAPRQGQPAPRYDPLSSASPGAMQYVQGLNLPMPNNQVFDPYLAAAPVAPAMQGGNNRPMQTTPGATPMPTRDFRPQAMAAPAPPMGTPSPRMAAPTATPQPQGTLMPPARPPTWTPYAPYGVTAGLPGVGLEDEESINQAVLWR